MDPRKLPYAIESKDSMVHVGVMEDDPRHERILHMQYVKKLSCSARPPSADVGLEVGCAQIRRLVECSDIDFFVQVQHTQEKLLIPRDALLFTLRGRIVDYASAKLTLGPMRKPSSLVL